MTGVIYAHWGSACYASNDLVAARAHYQEAIRLAEPWGNWEALQPSYLGLSRLCRAEGDWPAAFDALDSLERHATGAMARPNRWLTPSALYTWPNAAIRPG